MAKQAAGVGEAGAGVMTAPSAPGSASRPGSASSRPRTAAERQRERRKRLASERSKVREANGWQAPADRQRETDEATAADQARRDAELAASKAAAEAVTAATRAAEAEAARRLEAEYAAKLARTERLLVGAISGTVETLTEGIHLALLDGKKPHFGHERSQEVAKLWAPLIAPHINEDTAGRLPLVLAATATVGHVGAWAHAYRKAAP